MISVCTFNALVVISPTEDKDDKAPAHLDMVIGLNHTHSHLSVLKELMGIMLN
ncbi:PTS fructose transporter subunit IIA, partial [Clostridioides difficile]